jgi:hypothetical protein
MKPSCIILAAASEVEPDVTTRSIQNFVTCSFIDADVKTTNLTLNRGSDKLLYKYKEAIYTTTG